MRKGIVVFGAVFVDIKGYPLDLYIPGGRNVGRVVQVHGGVSRNVAEDIGNLQLAPTFISVVDDTGIGKDVVDRLQRHHINTEYIQAIPEGLGTWLAIFDNGGDVAASISRRPDLSAVTQILTEHGDEIFREADSIVAEIDMDPEQLAVIFSLAEKYGKEVYAVVSNMSIAMQRRDLLQKTGCVVCNLQEAGMLFSEDFSDLQPEQMEEDLPEILSEKIRHARIRRMIVTLGEYGSVYASEDGSHGYCPAQKVDVVDTTGAGDAFFAGAAVALTYGKGLSDACSIGTRLASSVITSKENVCPQFMPEEFDLKITDM